jgi:vacuolar-type H+-ATPase subunit I/STV1
VRWVLIIIGLLVLVIGIIWALQGTSILPYGQMAGHKRWIVIGGGLGIIGIILIILGARIRARTA